tara:strand:- start:10881 stop:12152 length:1272 start_codon:yes stop_codon:yes gene_type:complete
VLTKKRDKKAAARPDLTPGSPDGSSGYRWIVVAAVLVMQTLSSGLGFYNMSVYINRFAFEAGVPVSSISFAVSLFFIVGAVAGLYVADLMARWQPRTLIWGGSIIAAFALFLLGDTDTLWQVYLLFVVFGIGSAGISIVLATTLVTQWFPNKERAMALAIASTGLSLGGVVITPLTAYLTNANGLAGAMPLLAGLLVVVMLPVGWLVRMPPTQPVSRSNSQAAMATTLRAAVSSRFYIFLCAAFVLIMASQVGGIAHLYNRVEQLSSYTQAALAVQVLSVSSILGRFAGGWIVSRVPIRWFARGNLVLQAIGLSGIGLADNAMLVIFFAGVFGVSVGNLLMTLPLWLAEVFPVEIYAKVFARANAFSTFGIATGPFFMGVVFDQAWTTSAYTAPYLMAVGFSLIAFTFVLLASKHRLPEEAFA